MTGRTRRKAALRLLAAGLGARLGYAALRAVPPGGAAAWNRTNHRGEPVTLLEGPAVALAAAAAAAVPGLPPRERAALVLAGAGAGAVGCYDDLAGSRDEHGFRGHLGALVRGEITTGAVKIAGIGAAGLAASVLLGGSGRSAGSGRSGRTGPAGQLADIVINTGLIAGGANLVNLFDLRPGRAAKVTLIAGAALAASGPAGAAAAAPAVGAAAALLPEDLGERAMLGDCGANAAGAMLGAAAAAALPRPARLAVLAVVTGLTAASEKVSFTKVIAGTPALNWVDMLGRRPAAGPLGQAAAAGPARQDGGAQAEASAAPPP